MILRYDHSSKENMEEVVKTLDEYLLKQSKLKTVELLAWNNLLTGERKDMES
ncbi:MAG: hypothetical protein FWF87_09110 [Synergistaceae bacterium]|nr:hypothetical protein [Synergistaceae bacterium]